MPLLLREKLSSGVEIWTLNRPEKRNALSLDLLREFQDRLRTLDDSTPAVVITGAGGVFCAGLDLAVLQNLTPGTIDEFHGVISRAMIALFSCPAPTIASIRGVAVAGGFDLAVMCDMRVSTPDAKFGQFEVKLGLTGLTDPHWRIMGLGRAKESVYTAGLYDGREAHRIGLVNRLADDPLAEAVALAERIAGNDVAAVRAVKALTGGWPRDEIRRSLERQFEVFKEFLMSPRAQERISATLKSLK